MVGRLNHAGHGRYLGAFDTEHVVLVVYKDGSYELKSPSPTLHFDVPNIVLLRKLEPDTVVSAVYVDGETKVHYVKRFHIETTTMDKPFTFISESKGSKLLAVSTFAEPAIEVKLQRDKKAERKPKKFASTSLLK